jgi:hypothetical protein
VNSVKRTDIRRERLTYEEARRLGGLSPTTLWKLVRSGSVKGARVGHSVLFTRKPPPGIAIPEQQRARVLNGIAHLCSRRNATPKDSRCWSLSPSRWA